MKNIGPRTDSCGAPQMINKVRVPATAKDMLSSTRQVGAEPRQCCVIDAKGDPQPHQQNSVMYTFKRRGEVE